MFGETIRNVSLSKMNCTNKSQTVFSAAIFNSAFSFVLPRQNGYVQDFETVKFVVMHESEMAVGGMRRAEVEHRQEGEEQREVNV